MSPARSSPFQSGPGFPSAPEDDILLGIVCARNPGRCSAGLRRDSGPRFTPRLARRWYRPEAPCPLPCLGVIRIDEAADSVLAARDTHHDLVLKRQRRSRDRVTQLRIGHLGIPTHDSRFDIQCHQMRIECADINAIVQNRHAAVHLAAAAANTWRHAPHVLPQRTPGLRIQSSHAATRLAHIHDAVHYQGRSLNPLRSRHLIHPDRPQMLDVRRAYLIQPRIALRAVVAGVRQPVGGFGIGLAQAIVGNLRGQRQYSGQQTDHASHDLPRSEYKYATKSSTSDADNVPRKLGIGDFPVSLCNSFRSALMKECSPPLRSTT